MSSSSNSRIVDLVAPFARRGDCSGLQSASTDCYGRPPETGKNRSLSTARRRLLLGLLAAPCAAFANTDPLAGLRRWGSGDFRRFGFLVYQATLWAGDDPLKPPLALKLTYRRQIAGQAIAEASVKEIRNLDLVDAATLQRWGARMSHLFPDVQPGDAIVGVYRDGMARFYFNGQWLGEVDEAGFARAFFAIWLDERTSAPGLRAELLKRAEG